MRITVELDNGHVQTFADGQIEDCVKAAAWESAYEELQTEAKEAKLERENLSLKQELDTVRSQRAEVCEAKAQEVQKRMALEQELRDTQEKLDKRVDCNERIIAARDELRKQRDALMKRIGELEKEMRDAQAVNAKICDMRETVDGEQKKLIENLQERIQEQDVTIAKYDDENRELHNKLEKYETEAAKLVWKWDKGSTALTRWAKAIHENAVAHGWWAKPDANVGESGPEDGDRPFGEIIALCHSELSEALEEYRNGKPMSYEGENGKPEGVAVEMIDCIIRILDWCGKEGIDVDELLRKKHEYNKTRPYRHGGKKL